MLLKDLHIRRLDIWHCWITTTLYSTIRLAYLVRFSLCLFKKFSHLLNMLLIARRLDIWNCWITNTLYSTICDRSCPWIAPQHNIVNVPPKWNAYFLSLFNLKVRHMHLEENCCVLIQNCKISWSSHAYLSPISETPSGSSLLWALKIASYDEVASATHAEIDGLHHLLTGATVILTQNLWMTKCH